MQSVIDQIDLNLLRSAPPRRLPLGLILSLIGQRLASLSQRILRDPLLMIGLVGVLLMLVLWQLLVAALLLLGLALRTWLRWRGPIGVLYDDLMLLRDGQIVRAYILKSQIAHTLSGEPDGVYIDCAIPLEPRRTHIGSVWIADSIVGQEIARRGRVQVLCLPRAPGSWRLIEGGYSETRSSGGLTAEQRALMLD